MEGIVNNNEAGTHLTYIKDLKDSIQLQPPTRNLSLSVTRCKVFNQFILAGQFRDFPLYFLNTPVTKHMVSGRARSVHHWIDSRL